MERFCRRVSGLVAATLLVMLAACGGSGGSGGGTSTSGGTLTASANTADQNLVVGAAMSNFAPLTASGGTQPYSYQYFGVLPAGLLFDSATGIVSGTPTASYTSASLYFWVRDASHVMADTTAMVKFTVAPAYSISGTITGLNGTLVLQNNGGDDLTLSANGTFTFSKLVQDTTTYAVTILTQPTGQTCTVSTGAGTVSGGNVSNVNVTCSTNAYTVGGSISGLSGSVTLQNNSGDNLTLSANGSYTFPAAVAYNSPYAVTVLTPPTGQSCSIANGSGTMGAANVGNVIITCSVNTHTVGGNVTGLKDTVVLQNNGTDNLNIAVNGSFNFPTALNYGSSYNVSVLTQPAINRHCNIYNGSGTITGNVGNVGVACADNQIGGGFQTGAALNLTGTVSTIAGNITTTVYGMLDGTGAAAQFNNPASIATDGTNLYVADTYNHIIRKIVIATGVVTTLAGNGMSGATDGIGSAARFRFPLGITTDGTNLYVADMGNQKIRKIVIATGEVSSFTGTANTTMITGSADGAAATASFNFATNGTPPGADLITSDGVALYVADTRNNKIRKIVIATGEVSSLTGVANSPMTMGATDGAATVAQFSLPYGITTDGSNLYVADSNNKKIRKIVIATGQVSSLTGAANTASTAGNVDGSAATAQFGPLYGITTDGYNLYVADYINSTIRKIAIATGQVNTLAGGTHGALDGTGAVAQFANPTGITSDGSSLFVTDFGNCVIRQIR